MEVCGGRPGIDFIWLRGAAGPDQVGGWIIGERGRWHEDTTGAMMEIRVPRDEPVDIPSESERDGAASPAALPADHVQTVLSSCFVLLLTPRLRPPVAEALPDRIPDRRTLSGVLRTWRFRRHCLPACRLSGVAE